MVDYVSEIDERKYAAHSIRQPDKSSPDDKLNRSIIAMLQRDGRIAYSEIAQELGVSYVDTAPLYGSGHAEARVGLSSYVSADRVRL